MDNSPGDVTHTQGTSYLGPILVKIGYLEWNTKHTGIEWRLMTSGTTFARFD